MPTAQLEAVSDDVFADFGQASEYAMAARLSFPVTFFDFIDPSGYVSVMGFHLVDDGDEQMSFELRALLAAETPEDRRTVFVPIVGARGAPPEVEFPRFQRTRLGFGHFYLIS